MTDPAKIYKLPHIQSNIIINIEVSGAFLKKCQSLLLAISEKMGIEEVTASVARFKDPAAVPQDNDESTLWIMVSLVASLEKSAMDQNKVEFVEVTAKEAAELLDKKMFNGS
jgi:hypothetical protein